MLVHGELIHGHSLYFCHKSIVWNMCFVVGKQVYSFFVFIETKQNVMWLKHIIHVHHRAD